MLIISKRKVEESMNLKINTNIIKQVKSYAYLGWSITEDGKEDINKRITVVKNTFIKMGNVFESN